MLTNKLLGIFFKIPFVFPQTLGQYFFHTQWEFKRCLMIKNDMDKNLAQCPPVSAQSLLGYFNNDPLELTCPTWSHSFGRAGGHTPVLNSQGSDLFSFFFRPPSLFTKKPSCSQQEKQTVVSTRVAPKFQVLTSFQSDAQKLQVKVTEHIKSGNTSNKLRD